MRYYKREVQNHAETVVNMKHPEKVNEYYPEFVPSFHSWMLPQQQVEIADELANKTKPR